MFDCRTHHLCLLFDVRVFVCGRFGRCHRLVLVRGGAVVHRLWPIHAKIAVLIARKLTHSHTDTHKRSNHARSNDYINNHTSICKQTLFAATNDNSNDARHFERTPNEETCPLLSYINGRTLPILIKYSWVLLFRFGSRAVDVPVFPYGTGRRVCFWFSVAFIFHFLS